MNKLKELMKRCKCEISLSINSHKNDYITLEDELEDLDLQGITDDLDNDIRDKIIETQTLVMLYCYPNTPTGFFCSVHYDVDLAIQEVLQSFHKE